MLLALSGCGDEPAPPEESSVVQVAGTASAGGNPLILLDAETESVELPRLRLQTPLLNIAQVRMLPPNADGRCPESSSTAELPWRSFVAQLPFNLSRSIELRTPVPCVLELRPPSGEALMLVDGTFNDETPVRIEVLTDAALRLQILDLERLTLGGALMVFKPTSFLQEGFELSVGEDGTITVRDTIDSELRASIRDRLDRALIVYADPTPGDGTITAEERVPENIVALITAFEP